MTHSAGPLRVSTSIHPNILVIDLLTQGGISVLPDHISRTKDKGSLDICLKINMCGGQPKFSLTVERITNNAGSKYEIQILL
jgi:hypothetical protein